MINTIIFDLDGTLLNTIDDISDSMNSTLTHFNKPRRTLAEIKSFVGNGARQLVKLSVPTNTSEEEVDDIFNYYLNHYKENIQKKTRPYDGVFELLEALHIEGYNLAILSNKPDNGVKELNKQYFSTYITYAFGETAGIPKKPAKDGVLRAISAMNVDINSCIYVGDSEVDVMTAKNSNIPSIACTWGFRTRDELILHNPTYLVDKPLEILDLIISLN